MKWLRLFAVLVAVAVVVVGATAADKDARGWSKGTTAAQAGRVLSPLENPPELELPKDFMKSISGKVLLVYFSPGCPHCQKVTPELVALAKRMKAEGHELVLVSTGRASEGQLLEYKATYGIGKVPRIVVDTEAAFAQAMGIQSTPSALLVNKESKEKVRVVDAWYPYMPGFDTLVEMRLTKGGPFSAFRPGEYHGTQVCGTCHVYEAQSWQLTHHSVAWFTLGKHKKQDDAECIGCHVTGYQQPTGWNGHEDSVLADVGCEACHGPGGPHDGEPTAPESTCAGCHDKKHSIAFSYEKGLPLLDHFAAEGMTDQAFYERRKALAEGTAERGLLAFGEGKVQGAAACMGCHTEIHGTWSTSDHGQAMATLKKHGSHEDASCVSCHATARDMGPGAAAGLDAYLTDEGVGCEACHGPGEAHVEAGGGTDNIEKLGDDCPVCVIEAVCTRCHTQKWDPDWDLERDLARIKGHAVGPVPTPAP